MILIRDLIILPRIPCSRSFFPGSLRPLNNIRLQLQVYVMWCLMHLATRPEQLQQLAERSASHRSHSIPGRTTLACGRTRLSKGTAGPRRVTASEVQARVFVALLCGPGHSATLPGDAQARSAGPDVLEPGHHPCSAVPTCPNVLDVSYSKLNSL